MTEDSTQAYAGFKGHVGRIHSTSTPAWPGRPTAPDGAPNILVMLCDDLGYADLGCYGSEIDTPHLDRLAGEGLRYTNFHVNPMCSPTRASLLTGLNPHLAGVATVCHSDPGYPGYSAAIRDDAVTMAEALRDGGWATLMVGKWHLCPDNSLSEAGPRTAWPCQRGFDRYYGFLDGFTNFHQPHRLYEDNHVVHVDDYPQRLTSGPQGRGDGGIHVGMTVHEMERRLIMKTLESCSGNRTDAAGMLGISTRTLRNKLHEYGEMKAFKEPVEGTETQQEEELVAALA